MIDIWTESNIPKVKDRVADSKIWKMGTPVGVDAAASISTMQKQTATRKKNPVIAPIQTAQMIALGASFRASFISSVMCAVASAKESESRVRVTFEVMAYRIQSCRKHSEEDLTSSHTLFQSQ